MGPSSQSGREAPGRQCGWEGLDLSRAVHWEGVPSPSAGLACGTGGQKATDKCTRSPFMARTLLSPLREHGDVPHSKELSALPLLPTLGQGPYWPQCQRPQGSDQEGGGFPADRAQNQGQEGILGAAVSSPKASHSPYSQGAARSKVISSQP